MPSVSKAQRKLIAIAEHEPSKIRPENKGILKMKKKDMHDFASTKEKGLPSKARKKPSPVKRVSKQ